MICSKSRAIWNLNSELNKVDYTLSIVLNIEVDPPKQVENNFQFMRGVISKAGYHFLSEKQDEACLVLQTPNFQKLDSRLKLKAAFSKVFPIYKVTIFTVNSNSLVTFPLIYDCMSSKIKTHISKLSYILASTSRV